MPYTFPNLYKVELQWERFFTNLATCLKEQRGSVKFARLTGIDRSLFYRWLGRSVAPRSRTLSPPYIPSLETILECCYACDVTPLQVMMNQLTSLQAVLRKGTSPRPSRPRRPAPDRLDRESCLELINAILDGREEPLGLRQIAKRQGCIVRTLLTHFPQESVLITKHVQEYRKQRQELRLEQVRNQVRQTVITLHAQGILVVVILAKTSNLVNQNRTSNSRDYINKKGRPSPYPAGYTRGAGVTNRAGEAVGEGYTARARSRIEVDSFIPTGNAAIAATAGAVSRSDMNLLCGEGRAQPVARPGTGDFPLSV